jgi:hypothetical protein
MGLAERSGHRDFMDLKLQLIYWAAEQTHRNCLTQCTDTVYICSKVCGHDMC